MDRELSVESVLEGLAAEVADARLVSVACLSPSEQVGWVCGLQAARSAIDAVLCAATHDVAMGGLPTAAGHRTVGEVIGAQNGANPKDVAADHYLGRWLTDFGEFAGAFFAGRPSRRHVQVLRRADNKRTRTDLIEAQDYLIEAAGSCDWAGFVNVVRYWELAFDADGEEPREQGAANRFAFSKNHDGTVTGRFDLDPIAGQAVVTAVEQEEQRLRTVDDEADITRAASHRRAEALVNLIARGATRPDGTLPAPLVHIVMSEQLVETLINTTPAEPAAGAPEPDRLPTDPADPDGRCELIDGTPLHPHSAMKAAVASAFRRLVLSAEGSVLDLGRRARTFPPHLRQALLAAARGRCVVPGCSSGFAWLQADHINPWLRNGPTAVANGQILCLTHNRLKGGSPGGPEP